LIASRRLEEAVPVAERLAKRYTDFMQGHDILGIAWKTLKRPDKVVEAYDAGARLVPDSQLLRFRLTLAHFEAGDLAAGCRDAREGSSRWSGAADFLLLRARCEAGERKTEEALATLREVRRMGLDPAPYVEEAPEFHEVRASASYREALDSGSPPK
jgi:hypothetical protein